MKKKSGFLIFFHLMALAAFSQNVSPIEKALLDSNRKANEAKADVYIQSRRIIADIPQMVDTASSSSLKERKYKRKSIRK